MIIYLSGPSTETKEKNPLIHLSRLATHDLSRNTVLSLPSSSKHMMSTNQQSLEKKEKYTCEYCGKEYKRHSLFVKHHCEQKERILTLSQKNAFKYAFNAFNELMAILYKPKKSEIDFARSKFFKGLYAWGEMMEEYFLGGIHLEYCRYLLRQRVPLRNWCQELELKKFLSFYLIRENKNIAVSRSYDYIVEWCKKNNNDIMDYFSPHRANAVINDFRMGRINPWVLITDDNFKEWAQNLQEHQSDELSRILYGGIDTWMKKALLANGKNT